MQLVVLVLVLLQLVVLVLVQLLVLLLVSLRLRLHRGFFRPRTLCPCTTCSGASARARTASCTSRRPCHQLPGGPRHQLPVTHPRRERNFSQVLEAQITAQAGRSVHCRTSRTRMGRRSRAAPIWSSKISLRPRWTSSRAVLVSLGLRKWTVRSATAAAS